MITEVRPENSEAIINILANMFDCSPAAFMFSNNTISVHPTSTVTKDLPDEWKLETLSVPVQQALDKLTMECRKLPANLSGMKINLGLKPYAPLYAHKTVTL